MKKITAILVSFTIQIFVFPDLAYAQQTNPDAAVEISVPDSNQGIKFPHVTNVLRPAANPQNAGLVVYNADHGCLQVCNGVAWSDCFGFNQVPKSAFKVGIGQGQVQSPIYPTVPTSMGSIHIIDWTNELFDTNNEFDIAGSNRFQPKCEGRYQIHVTVCIQSPANWSLYIIKNGIVEEYVVETISNPKNMSISAIVNANGATDYFEIGITRTVGPGMIVGDYRRTRWEAYKL